MGGWPWCVCVCVCVCCISGMAPRRQLGSLFLLETLDLSGNALTGTVPAAALSRCASLRCLNLSSNKLTGRVPQFGTPGAMALEVCVARARHSS